LHFLRNIILLRVLGFWPLALQYQKNIYPVNRRRLIELGRQYHNRRHYSSDPTMKLTAGIVPLAG